MWKEEEHSPERVNHHRFQEAVSIGADTLAVACPFCLTMMNDARKDLDSSIEVLDVAEIVAQHLVKPA